MVLTKRNVLVKYHYREKKLIVYTEGKYAIFTKSNTDSRFKGSLISYYEDKHLLGCGPFSLVGICKFLSNISEFLTNYIVSHPCCTLVNTYI